MLGLRGTDPVGRLMGDVVATVRPSTSLREAARQLTRELVSLLVVIDASGVRGVISERDVVTAVADEVDLDAERVIDHATGDVVTVDEATGITDAAVMMAAAEVRHLAVTRRGEVVGVISARDLVGVLAEAADDAAALG